MGLDKGKDLTNELFFLYSFLIPNDDPSYSVF